MCLQLHAIGEAGNQDFSHQAARIGQYLVKAVGLERELRKLGRGDFAPKQLQGAVLIRVAQGAFSA